MHNVPSYCPKILANTGSPAMTTTKHGANMAAKNETVLEAPAKSFWTKPVLLLLRAILQRAPRFWNDKLSVLLCRQSCEVRMTEAHPQFDGGDETRAAGLRHRRSRQRRRIPRMLRSQWLRRSRLPFFNEPRLPREDARHIRSQGSPESLDLCKSRFRSDPFAVIRKDSQVLCLDEIQDALVLRFDRAVHAG